MPGASVCRRTGDGIVLAVRLTPKSAREEIGGIEETADGRRAIRARVRAVPEKGGANAALEKLVARWLGVPPSRVRLAGGGKARLKSVAVAGDPEELSAVVRCRLAEMERS